jgi:YggT family protein
VAAFPTVKLAGVPCAFRRADYTSLAQRERRRPAMLELLRFINLLLQLYVYVLIAAAVFSWLIAFNVINPRSPAVSAIGNLLYQITEPVLRPIRNMLPSMGGIDISPVIVILIILFIQTVILPNLARALIA